MFNQFNVALVVVMALVAASVVTFLLTPAVKELACRIGAVDVPKDNRRMHKEPIPRMGGLAIFLGFFIAVLLFNQRMEQTQSMLMGAVLIVILGVLDDKFTLLALPKFLVQIAAALVAVLGGNAIHVISNPNVFSPNPYWNLGVWSVPLSVLWIVTVTNAVNLIDGLDGLAVGVSTISSLTMLVIALLVSDGEVAIMMAALCGACMGFMPYNKNPAQIFMGDTGSTFLGYILAVASIQGLFKFYSLISFVVPFLMLGLPIFDTAFAFVRRISHGQNPMKADRSHVHHRLVDMGLSQKQAVAVLYVISAILGVCAVVLTTGGALRAIFFLATVVVAGIVVWKVITNKGEHGEMSLEDIVEEEPQETEASEAAEEAAAPAETEPADQAAPAAEIEPKEDTEPVQQAEASQATGETEDAPPENLEPPQADETSEPTADNTEERDECNQLK